MDKQVAEWLCDPDTRFALEWDGDSLRNRATGRLFPVRDGIPLFLSTVSGPNLKYQALYDRLAPGFDLAERLRSWVTRKPSHRAECLSELELRPGARVLEVGVGTGANLRFLPADIDFYGLDLSWGMLQKCRRNVHRWGRQAQLFHGEAERLPFVESCFDCVFHVGGIHFFSDPARALREMVWVARPGTKIVVVDKTEKGMRGHDRRNPVPKACAGLGSEQLRCPIDQVPEGMEDVHTREIVGGRMYCLAFRKPLI